MWEILDPSNLKYNTDLGYTWPVDTDSGQGPPSSTRAWVRTGYNSSTSTTAGQGNCDAWTSSSGGDYGTTAYLPNGWTGGWEDIHVWTVAYWGCSTPLPVWCVED